MMELALRFTHAAAQVLWVGALVALGVFAVERLFTRTAAGRHAVHLFGLLLTALVLPVAFMLAPVTLIRPASYVAAKPDAAKIAPAPGSREPVAAAGPFLPAASEKIRGAGKDGQAGGHLSLAAEGPAAEWEKIAPWVTGAYLTGLLGMLARMACGFAGSTRMRRRGDSVGAGIWTEALRRMSDRMRVRVQPAMKWSREVAAPVIVGLVKPVILLPVALASRLSPEQVEAVLAHELAHLRRRDTWALAAQRVVETVLFFHPAVWWMSRRLEAMREEACDDLVLVAGCDPADYAEALLSCSECRAEPEGFSPSLASGLGATGNGGKLLSRRILRLIGGGDDGAVRLGRTGWMLGLLLIGGVVLAVAGGNAGRPDLADFNFNNPPSAYEKDIQVADRNQRFKVDGLQFQASPLRWEQTRERAGGSRLPKDNQGPGEELILNLGVSQGYEIVEIRLFDHATRKLIDTSKWQPPTVEQPKFLVERVGATDWLRMKETGGTLPDRIDVWLRIATSASGKPIVLKAEDGASTRLGRSEILVTSVLEGSMNGRGSGPDGKMIWDLSSAHEQDRTMTVNLENRGDVLRGRYHLVAVTRDGVRHPMDDTHFWDFARMNRNAYFRMDVAVKDLDYLELVPFKDRHKFFFNGLEVPREKLPELSRQTAKKIEAWASDGPLRLSQIGPTYPLFVQWEQGVRFRYPYDGPGLPKSFSVAPPREHYFRLPKVDPQTGEGRQAIWQAFEAGTEGAGFTIDGNEIVTFHGLRVMPLWDDGPPYPTTWDDWIDRTSHRELLEQIERNGQAGRSGIPEDGLLLGVDPQRHLHVIGLRKVSGDYQYSVWTKALDPFYLSVNAAPSKEEPFVEWSFCTLHDLESGAADGGLNLNRAQMVKLNENVRKSPGPDAILAADFQNNKVGWVVPGAGDFVMVPLDGEPSARDLITALRTSGQRSTPGHEQVNTENQVLHFFQNLRPGQWFGFAARMPGAVPVAGLIELRSVDVGAKTLTMRHRFLRTNGARAVFLTGESEAKLGGTNPNTGQDFQAAADARTPAWGEATDGVQVRLHSPRQEWSKDEFSVFFKTDLRSETEHVFPHYGPPIAEFFLELDGQWYETKNRGAAMAASVGPSAATLRENLHTAITARHWRSMVTGEPMPEFSPGRHIFRIGFPLSDKPDASGQRRRAVSNPIELVIRPRDESVSITGQVTGVTGKPADVYRVTALPKEWSASWGEMPETMTGTDGSFTFRGLPDGPCDVSATPVPLTDQPNMRIQGIVLKKGAPVQVTLSLEKKYSFGGWVTDASGQPLEGRSMLAIWKDPAGKNTYSSYTKTDADGQYRFKAPFEVAERILISDGDPQDHLESRNVQAGREDADFQIPARGSQNTNTNTVLGEGFGATIQQSIGPDFQSGIDIDAGLVRKLPDNPQIDRKSKPWEAWLAEIGTDLWVSPIDSPPMPVHGLDMAAVRTADGDWDIQPADLVRRLDGVAMKASTLLMDDKARYPATFLVRTREGGLGVLQILGYNNAVPTGWNVRYKMLGRSRAAGRAGAGELAPATTNSMNLALPQSLAPLAELEARAATPASPPAPGTNEEKRVLLTEVISQKQTVRLGDPIVVSLRVTNQTSRAAATIQSATAFDCFEVIGPDGKRLPYIGFDGQAAARPMDVPPFSAVTLANAEALDLTDKYLFQKPGRYSVRFSGMFTGLADSPAITFEVTPGRLSEFDQVVVALLAVCPDSWGLVKDSRGEVTPLGRSRASGFTLHLCHNHMRGEAVFLWFMKDPSQTLGAEYMRRVRELFVYESVGNNTPALWPTAAEDISRALQITKP